MCGFVRHHLQVSPNLSVNSVMCYVLDPQLVTIAPDLTFPLFVWLQTVDVHCSHPHWGSINTTTGKTPLLRVRKSAPRLLPSWSSVDLVERSREWLVFQSLATPCHQGAQELVVSIDTGSQDCSSLSHWLSPLPGWSAETLPSSILSALPISYAFYMQQFCLLSAGIKQMPHPAENEKMLRARVVSSFREDSQLFPSWCSCPCVISSCRVRTKPDE